MKKFRRNGLRSVENLDNDAGRIGSGIVMLDFVDRTMFGHCVWGRERAKTKEVEKEGERQWCQIAPSRQFECEP